MKHKPHILLIGFHNSLSIESLNQIAFKKCDSGQQAIELIISNQFDLIISKFQLEDLNTIELNQSVETVRNYYANNDPKTFKLLVITSNSDEEEVCKKSNLLYFPETLDLKLLVLKLIELPKEPRKRSEKKALIIDFKELFIRVDNNREFIQTVIKKFFEVSDSRINDIKSPLLAKEFKQAKGAAHKLKGVLANFSMLEARTTIVELENLIVNENHDLALQKLQQLIGHIEKAKKFYYNNLDQFKNL
jgi:HPt (histidine-containing phosphotransfer) domain-containing protein